MDTILTDAEKLYIDFFLNHEGWNNHRMFLNGASYVPVNEGMRKKAEQISGNEESYQAPWALLKDRLIKDGYQAFFLEPGRQTKLFEDARGILEEDSENREEVITLYTLKESLGKAILKELSDEMFANLGTIVKEFDLSIDRPRCAPGPAQEYEFCTTVLAEYALHLYTRDV